jgi:hypothetical protein
VNWRPRRLPGPAPPPARPGDYGGADADDVAAADGGNGNCGNAAAAAH